jgi:hypothetical protein
VQAANDFLVFGAVAMASLSSGKLLHIGGWDIVNWVVFPAVALALVMVAIQARSRPALAV